MKKNKIIIIAEAGVNHNGDLNIAKKLIDVACKAKVDYVKFQSFKAENLVSRTAKKASYQVENHSKENSFQYDMLKKLELNKKNHYTLLEYCNNKKINFLSTPFDSESLKLLVDMGISCIKISSGDITNFPFLKEVGKLNKQVILSTGMSNLIEVGEAIAVLLKSGLEKDKLIVLHCNTEYPTPFEDVNLSAMNTISKAFGVKVGYSDHTMGIEVPIAAVAMGAVCIEKHITLDRSMEGPDHKSSLEPDELKQMVQSIRNIEKAIGNGLKKPSKSELKNIEVVRKSIHISKKMKKGEYLSKHYLSIKRPAIGILPKFFDKIIKKKLIKDVEKDKPLMWDDLEQISLD